MTYTRDEIMAMTPEQLRIAIADAKGWIDNRQSCENEFLGPDNEWYYLESDYHGDKLLPDWPADIRAAWELVEEIIATDDELGANLYYTPDGNEWNLCVDRYDYDYGRDKDALVPLAFASAETATLAICRAWLLWKATA